MILATLALLFTIDDAPSRQGLWLAEYLHHEGVRATFFLTGCHFRGVPKPDARSWICNQGHEKFGIQYITKLKRLGHTVGNHTMDHVPLNELSNREIRYQVGTMQRLLRLFQRDVPFRAPGLITDERVNRVLSRMGLRSLGQTAGGQGFIDGQWIGGDWDCQRKGYAVNLCGDLYVRQIEDDLINGRDSIVLMHARTEYMADDDPWPLQLAQYLVSQLKQMEANHANEHQRSERAYR